MDTVKRIAKRMSPKENRKSYKENVPFSCHIGRKNHYGKGFPYGKRTSSVFIKDCGTDTVTVTSGRLTNGFLRLFRT